MGGFGSDCGFNSHYPWAGMEDAKPKQLHPLIKTEIQYDESNEDRPEVVIEKIPYSATGLAKLQGKYS